MAVASGTKSMAASGFVPTVRFLRKALPQAQRTTA